MSHEIYYTSAPEGLKRGSSGFCTVAATEGIPRALGDRLETLSAYRHHFSPAEGARDGGGVNPVSYAHYILAVSRKTFHVLSRVCDSGVDHTQRTNAFAHHLVVESPERETAAGGPAWMLRQAGVMATSWNQAVGPIQPRALPRGGEMAGSKICTAWERATGDPGWGGHLADVFTRSPTRPVCILFAPGQDPMPLITEAIALLTPSARWNVTFNTYFTSLPTSATCLWRCCLAGTPAAQVGVRYAAAGLILDLTDRPGFGRVPEGPLVQVARTGRMAATVAKPAAGGAGPPRSGAPAKVLAVKGATKPPVMDDEEEELERQRAATFETIELAPLPPAPSQPEPPPVQYDPAAEIPVPAMAAPTAAAGGRASLIPKNLVRRAQDRLREAEMEAQNAAGRRRTQVMLLFGGALAAIAVGMGFVWWATRHPLPPAEPLPPEPGPTVQRTIPEIPPLVVPVPDPGGTIPIPPAPDVVHQQTPVTNPTVIPIPPTPPPVAITFPERIALATAIERPNLGNGMRDREQSIALKMSDIDTPAAITGLRMHFPQPRAFKAGDPEDRYSNDLLGKISATSEPRNGKPAAIIRWKSASDGSPGPGVEALFIAFDRLQAKLDVTWKSGPLQANPSLMGFLWWMLSNSTLELEGPRTKSQRIVFKPFDPGAFSLAKESAEIAWPFELPQETTVLPPKLTSLPSGWEASWYTDWDTKDAALRSPLNASQVLKFKKPTSSAAVDAWFLITFKPGLGKAECSFAKRLASDRADLAQFQSELNAINDQIEKEKASIEADPTSTGARDLLAKKAQTSQLVDAYKASIAAYEELKGFEVGFDLSDGLRLVTLRFEQGDKAGGADTGKQQ